MTVRLRLQREGRPNKPFYRLVAIHRLEKRDGKPIEILGYYDPKAKLEESKLNLERINYWVSQGAELTETVTSLIKRREKAVKSA